MLRIPDYLLALLMLQKTPTVSIPLQHIMESPTGITAVYNYDMAFSYPYLSSFHFLTATGF